MASQALLEISEICSILHIGKTNAYKLVKEKLPHIKIGKKYLVSMDTLEKYLKDNTNQNN